MREHDSDPGDVVPWEDVRAEAKQARERHRRERALGEAKRKTTAGKRKCKR
jgi:hypothetical protein